MSDPFRYFNSSPEVIRLVVMMYVKYPLSLRNVEDLLAERGIDISHETVRFWWNRFGPMFVAEIRRDSSRGRSFRWRWSWPCCLTLFSCSGRGAMGKCASASMSQNSASARLAASIPTFLESQHEE